ncbi:low-density lipoprotein receptor-related protein 6-like [Saccostrea cucullata]|uniref:low-density lipoprotein receptor-related protein 6-like n=1 Tax=Saccostrea cuccullata TaxID=36930 RepID=UPI002ED3663C
MSAVSDVTECNGLTSFLCKNDRCISDQKECNGVDDCGDGSDEEECDEEELLVFAYRTSLNVMSLSNLTSHVVPLQGVKNAIAVDFDPVEKQIYWSDVTLNTINKAFLDGSGQQIVINGVPQASGIALDTVNRRLYWTDADKGTVEMSDLDGGQRTTIVTDGLTMPRDIAVDSKNKKLYWSDVGGDTKIEKSNLDGTDRVVIVNTSNGWPNGIALDTDNGIIYWGDARFHRIEMANLDGSNRSILLSSEVKHLFGLSQLGDYLYWSDWRDSSIGRINKNLKDNAELLHTTEFTLTPMDLKAFVIRDQKRNRLIFKTPDHNVEESESFFHDFTEGGWWVGDRTTSYLNGVYGSPRWRNIWLPHITSGEDFLSSQMMVRRNIRQ